MTSIYRQIGIGCERLLQQILQDSFGLTKEDVAWSYEVQGDGSRRRRLALDGRLELAAIGDRAARDRVRGWMADIGDRLQMLPRILNSLTGVVFEARQGYKSKDSKRQNADIANASNACVRGYLPCVLVFSDQMDDDVLTRYRHAKWAVLTGTLGADDALTSTYDFMRDVIGYDLEGFFQRNSDALRTKVAEVLNHLLLVCCPGNAWIFGATR